MPFTCCAVIFVNERSILDVSLPKGVTDLLPEQAARITRIEAILKEVE